MMQLWTAPVQSYPPFTYILLLPFSSFIRCKSRATYRRSLISAEECWIRPPNNSGCHSAPDTARFPSRASRWATPAEGADRRSASAVLSDVYALTQHEIVWASEAELTWTVADRAMTAAQEADSPVALAGAAWTLGMVQRSAGDIDGALSLARDATALLEPLMDDGSDDVPALSGALELHAATTCARAGREGDAWRYWDRASTIAQRLPDGYNHPWTMFGASNVELHAVSISADLSKSQEARSRAEQIDPEEIPSRERRGRLGVEIARSYGQRQDYPGGPDRSMWDLAEIT